VDPAGTRRRSTAREKRRQTELRILETTEALLRDHSFHELSVEDVMAGTGLVRTAFYRYFPDMESVLANLLGTITLEVDAGNAWLTAPDDSDFYALLRMQAENIVRIYGEHGRLVAAIVDAATTHPDIRRIWCDTCDGYIRRMAARIADLNSRSVTCVAHPEATAAALVTMIVHYLTDTFRSKWTGSTQPVVETVTDVLYRSIFAPAALAGAGSALSRPA
jgi:TetR/AcrR family transcriptional regulator, ethionamide resistance regulator